MVLTASEDNNRYAYFLWAISEPSRLNKKHRKEMEIKANIIHISGFGDS